MNDFDFVEELEQEVENFDDAEFSDEFVQQLRQEYSYERSYDDYY
jgi:hypothetical protein